MRKAQRVKLLTMETAITLRYADTCYEEDTCSTVTVGGANRDEDLYVCTIQIIALVYNVWRHV